MDSLSFDNGVMGPILYSSVATLLDSVRKSSLAVFVVESLCVNAKYPSKSDCSLSNVCNLTYVEASVKENKLCICIYCALIEYLYGVELGLTHSAQILSNTLLWLFPWYRITRALYKFTDFTLFKIDLTTENLEQTARKFFYF